MSVLLRFNFHYIWRISGRKERKVAVEKDELYKDENGDLPR